MQKLLTCGDLYRNFINDIETKEDEFKKWYDYEKPEKEDLPGNYSKLR